MVPILYTDHKLCSYWNVAVPTYVRLETNTECAIEALITDQSTCKLAAESLGFKFQGSAVWSSFPRGCFYATVAKFVEYNTHMIGKRHYGKRPICRKSEFYCSLLICILRMFSYCLAVVKLIYRSLCPAVRKLQIGPLNFSEIMHVLTYH